MSKLNEIFKVERIQMPIRFDEVTDEYGTFRVYEGVDYWWTRSGTVEFGDVVFGAMDDVRHMSRPNFQRGVLCVCRI